MKNKVVFSIALFLTASIAVGQDVRYNFDKDTEFAKFKTYKWIVLKDAPKVDSLREKQITDTVEAELATKGLTKTDSDEADLYIGFQVGVGTEKQFTSYNTDWGYGPGWYRAGWYGGGGGMTTGQTSTIYTGQLAIDFYDSKHHDLVWRGVASKTIDTKAKPEKQQKNLTKAVAKLLKAFPPPLK